MVLHEDHPSIGAFPVLLVVGDDAQGILQVLPYHPPQVDGDLVTWLWNGF